MAKRLGSGSPRIVFEIPYQGRRTSLKIAKSNKGMVQNEEEAIFCDDWFLKKLGTIVPCIDYDQKNSKPTWLHMEYAAKAKESDFKREIGGTSNDLVNFVKKQLGRNFLNIDVKINEKHSTVQAFMDYYVNYDANIENY